jgi:hypothetical protein
LDHVNVDFMPVIVGEDVTPGLCVFVASRLESSLTQCFSKPWLIASVDQDVEVPMARRLTSEGRVDGPSAVDPELNLELIGEVEQIERGLEWHVCYPDTLANRT